ncbi:DUF2971 domain-containing protein [Devosia sp.]|uniref:DUF2971 domain-containing protein n=1 Tax=Devosia sp. TaxID=1871048 RepID=UPI00261E98AD|nr:DUF2971 domain-containing protein [Devosia sp.]
MTGLLYHYCGTPTAFSILHGRTIRLSPLSAANDTLEGRLLGQAFSEVLRQTSLTEGVRAVAEVIVDGYPTSTEGFAFCLSEDGDLLSQWRAYAGDGTGIAIGFARDGFLTDFGPVTFGRQYFELLKVAYGTSDLLQELKPSAMNFGSEFVEFGEFVKLRPGTTKADALSSLSDRDGDVHGLFQCHRPDAPELLDRMLKALAPLHFRIYGTKPKAFYEEREWRLIRYQHRVASSNIKFLSDGQSIRPYVECLIADPAKDVVQEVVLGPKHKSDINWVRSFLGGIGLGHVHVTRSAIDSYR